MMTLDAWGKLWDIAVGEPGGVATITPDPDNAGEVTLTWPDGSSAGLYWHAGAWQFHEALNTAPCDVAARDAF